MNADTRLERALGSARGSARAIVTVCAAVLALVVSTPSRNVYRDAERELTTLIELDRRKVLAEIVVQLDPEAAKQVDALAALLQEFDLALSLGPGNFLFVEPGASAFEAPDPRFDLLLNVESSLRSWSTLRGEVGDVTSVASSLREQLAANRSSIQPGVTQVWLHVSDRTNTDSEVRVYWLRGLSENFVPLQLPLPFPATNFSIEFDPLAEFIKRADTAVLVGSDERGLIWLPNTHRPEIWGRVRDRRLVDARTFLEDLANAPERSLDVLGVTLPSRLVSIGATLALLLLSVHFSVYVRYFLKAAGERAAPAPWIAVLPRFEARMFTAILLIALPAATGIAIAFAARGESVSLRIVSGALFLGAFIIIAYHALALGYRPVRRHLLRHDKRKRS
jgi:hypothetical protein